jgi:hypothetical protein
MSDELTRLRSALAAILVNAHDLTEAHRIAAEALAKSSSGAMKPPPEYAEARTLTDLDPDAWRIVGTQVGDKTRYTIPNDEIATFRQLRKDGRITSALHQRGDYRLILARRLRPAPEAKTMQRRRTAVVSP